MISNDKKPPRAKTFGPSGNFGAHCDFRPRKFAWLQRSSIGLAFLIKTEETS